MYIVVKYGHNETLVVNPSCAVVNLLTSIKRRAGYAGTNLVLDLAEDTGELLLLLLLLLLTFCI